jgi:hypothetical protein
VSRVAQSVQCLATGCAIGQSRFDLWKRQKDFSSNLCVQTGSGVHPASYTMGTGRLRFDPRQRQKDFSSNLCVQTGFGVHPASYTMGTGRLRFDPRQRQKHFSSSLCVQTGSGANPASCTMGTGGPFPGAKARPGRDADNSPPCRAEV